MSEHGFEDGELVPTEEMEFPHKAIDDKLDAELQEIVDRRVDDQLAKALWEVVLRIIIEVRAHTRPEVTATALAFVAGLYVLEGKSVTQLAEELSEGHPPGHPRHITKQALSRRITNLAKQLGLPPSRGMKSEKAREAYKAVQLNKAAAKGAK